MGRFLSGRRSGDRQAGGMAGGPASRRTLELDLDATSPAAPRGAGSAAQGPGAPILCARDTSNRTSSFACSSASCVRARSKACSSKRSPARPACRPRVRRAAMLAGDTGAGRARRAGRAATRRSSRSSLQPFQPVQPMLADSAADVDEALAALGEASFEYKLDGARIQVHKVGDEVRVYSRNLRDVTVAVPEVVEVARALPARETDPRRRGHRAARPTAPRIRFRSRCAASAASSTSTALRQRAAAHALLLRLRSTSTASRCSTSRSPAESPRCRRTGRRRSSSRASSRPMRTRRRRLLARALATGHEGVMAKALDGRYAAGRRGQTWLKVKQARTLDWSSSPPSGAAAAATAGSATCTSARATPSAAAS